MKKILLLVSVFVWLILPFYAQAKDFEITLKGVYTIYQDRDLREDGKGIKGEVRWKYLYLWGTWEQTEMRLTGQVAGNLNLYGVGVGTKIKVLKPLSVFIETGYYIPSSDLQKNTMKYAEGVGYYWVRTLKEIGLDNEFFRGFNRYRYEIKPNIGGSIGLEFEQVIYKNLSLNLFGAYRLLNLKEDWDAFNSIGQNIQTKEKRSFSGGQFGIGLSYRW